MVKENDSEGKEREAMMEHYVGVVGTRHGVQLRDAFREWAGPKTSSSLFFMKRVVQLLPGGARQISDPRRQPNSLVSKRHR